MIRHFIQTCFSIFTDGGSSLSSPKSHSQSSQNEIENYAPSNALIMDRIREEGADSETVTTGRRKKARVAL